VIVQLLVEEGNRVAECCRAVEDNVTVYNQTRVYTDFIQRDKAFDSYITPSVGLVTQGLKQTDTDTDVTPWPWPSRAFSQFLVGAGGISPPRPQRN